MLSVTVTCAFGLLEMFTCTFYTDTQRISLKADDVTVRNLGRIFAVSTTTLWYSHMMVATCKCISSSNVIRRRRRKKTGAGDSLFARLNNTGFTEARDRSEYRIRVDMYLKIVVVIWEVCS